MKFNIKLSLFLTCYALSVYLIYTNHDLLPKPLPRRVLKTEITKHNKPIYDCPAISSESTTVPDCHFIRYEEVTTLNRTIESPNGVYQSWDSCLSENKECMNRLMELQKETEFQVKGKFDTQTFFQCLNLNFFLLLGVLVFDKELEKYKQKN